MQRAKTTGSLRKQPRPTKRTNLLQRSDTSAAVVVDEEQYHELRHQEDEIKVLEALRQRLLQLFGSQDAAFKALDWHGNGLLTFEDIKAGLKDWDINVKLMEPGGVDLKRIFTLLDIDGSGYLDINELMEMYPWRSEDEGLILFRARLLEKFGSREKVYEVLDVNSDGSITYEELQQGLTKIGLAPMGMTGGIDLGRVFDLLDYDLSGSLSIAELFDADPREETHRRDEAVTRLRKALNDYFPSKKELLRKLDTNGNGTLAYGELKDGLERSRFDYKSILQDISLLWVFKVLDTDGSGDLSISELMLADPEREAAKAAASKRERFAARKKNAKEKKKSKDTSEALLCEIPPGSPRSFESLSPALQKIALFGADKLQPAETIHWKAIVAGLEDAATWTKKTEAATVELDLSHAHLQKNGAAALARGLLEPRFKHLKKLQLMGNYIGPEGVAYIAFAAQNHQSLKFLGLGWNHVDDDGAKRLAALASKVKSLKKLNLCFNRIGDEGAQAFAKVLTGSKSASLSFLDLSDNNIENLGASKLRSACRKVDLVLNGNPSERVSPYKEPAVGVTPGPGGLLLPQVRKIVVAGWPQRSTTPEARSRTDASLDFANTLDHFVARPNSSMRKGPATASALKEKPWGASFQLGKSLSEAALSGITPKRNWSRGVVLRHTMNNFSDPFPLPPADDPDPMGLLADEPDVSYLSRRKSSQSSKASRSSARPH